MAGFRIEGNTSGNVAEVTAQNAMRVAHGDDSAVGGILATTARADGGLITGQVLDIDPEADQDSRLRVGLDRIEFQETWAGAALNSAQWQSNVTTAATAIADSSLALNSANSAAANAVARVSSYRHFQLQSPGVLTADFDMRVLTTAPGTANTTWEAGFFVATGTAAPNDGVLVRMNAAGEMRLVVNYAGAETQSAPIPYSTSPAGWPGGGAILPLNDSRAVTLTMHSEAARLWINGILVAEVPRQVGNASLCRSQALPFTVRLYNGAVAPATATQLRIGPVAISTSGAGANVLTAPELATLSGGGGYQGQSGMTMGSTANYANSAAPANATLSNTAAGYATLGGQYAFAAPLGAETDYAIFAYTVPAPAAGSINKSLLIHGVRIDAVNTGAAVATTATVLQWSLGVGSTAASLATAEAATTRAPRRIPLGVQSWVVGSAIGAPVEALVWTFRGGLLAEPGSVVHAIVKVPVGTATASQIIRGVVSFDASWV
jgi:hypothetical protein